MKHNYSKRVRCPYYRHEDRQVIYCDGPQEGTVIHLAFANATDAKQYKDDVCRFQYGTCQICMMHRNREVY